MLESPCSQSFSVCRFGHNWWHKNENELKTNKCDGALSPQSWWIISIGGQTMNHYQTRRLNAKMQNWLMWLNWKIPSWERHSDVTSCFLVCRCISHTRKNQNFCCMIWFCIILDFFLFKFIFQYWINGERNNRVLASHQVNPCIPRFHLVSEVRKFVSHKIKQNKMLY